MNPSNISRFPRNILAPPTLGGSPSPAARLVRFPLSLLYGVGARLVLRYRSRSPRRLDCPVVSIGNITVGGTGKTSLVALLAARLRDKGLRVGIVLRGYKGRSGGKGPVIVSSGAGPAIGPDEAGDEAWYLARTLPGCAVAIGADRFRAGRRLLDEERVEVVLLDDGFQAGGLFRDLDIVCLSLLDPFGGRRPLPAGRLREPLSALSRADGVCLTRIESFAPEQVEQVAAQVLRLNPSAWIARSRMEITGLVELQTGRELPAESLAGTRVYLMSGLGDNDYFRATAARIGIKIGGHAIFPDHYRYSLQDIREVTRAASVAGAEAVLTSAKDAARLETVRARLKSDLPVLILLVEAVLSDEGRLNESLDKLAPGRSGP